MDFNEKVWNAIKKVPKGRVSTYKLIAKSIGKPKAFRAAGNACNKNPFSPEIACHRIVKSDARLGGFAFGATKKTQLLKKEGIKIKKGKIIGFKEKLFKF